MSRMIDPDLFNPTPGGGRGQKVPRPDAETRHAEVRQGFIDAGITLEGPPKAPAGMIPLDKSRWTWQAVGTWAGSGILARCDQHPRLERVKRTLDGMVIEAYYVNGEPQPSYALALTALAHAETKGRCPSPFETFLTYQPVVIEGTTGEPVDSELESLEAARR